MGKALVIKNVNFATNALTQVTLEEEIPCTAISLSESSVSLTSLTATTLTANVTPNDTTDAITWLSSDNTIATVANGIVTPLKGGSVTITAVCGSQSATCEFSIRVFIDPELLYGYYFALNLSGGQPDTVAVAGGSTATTYGGTIYTDGTGRYARDPDSKVPDNKKAYPVMLPVGCTSLKLTFPSQSIKSMISWCDSTVGSPNYGTVKARQQSGNVWDGTAGDRTENVPTGIGNVDCIYLSVYLKSNLTQEMLDQITVEALYA